MVRTYCATYNHEPYILDALNGFVIQQTNFPVVFTIVDDASTDRNAEVIRGFVNDNFDLLDTSVAFDVDTDYGHVTFARHKINNNCFFAVVFLKENHYTKKKAKSSYLQEWMDTKYVAVCEGDDYWTDSMKLQRQVDFLEEHQDYSASTENGMVLYFDSQTTELFSSGNMCDVSFEDLLIKRRFPTASVLYRTQSIDGIEKLTPPRFDTLVWAYLSTKGKIHFNPVVSSVYRRGPGITSSDKIRWAYLVRSYNNSLYKNFEVPDEVKKVRDDDLFDSIVQGVIEAKRKGLLVDVARLSYYGLRMNPARMIKIIANAVIKK